MFKYAIAALLGLTSAQHPDPRKYYYDKMGSQFSVGFLGGTKVGYFDEIDIYECVEKEPKAETYFYLGDLGVREGMIHKDGKETVAGLDEMVHFIIEMIMEDYPHSRTQVCHDFDKTKKAQWDDMKLILHALDNKETTLAWEEDRLWFNKKDITAEGKEMIEAWAKQEFVHLGWKFGEAM